MYQIGHIHSGDLSMESYSCKSTHLLIIVHAIKVDYLVYMKCFRFKQ